MRPSEKWHLKQIAAHACVVCGMGPTEQKSDGTWHRRCQVCRSIKNAKARQVYRQLFSLSAR